MKTRSSNSTSIFCQSTNLRKIYEPCQNRVAVTSQAYLLHLRTFVNSTNPRKNVQKPVLSTNLSLRNDVEHEILACQNLPHFGGKTFCSGCMGEARNAYFYLPTAGKNIVKTSKFQRFDRFLTYSSSESLQIRCLGELPCFFSYSALFSAQKPNFPLISRTRTIFGAKPVLAWKLKKSYFWIIWKLSWP